MNEQAPHYDQPPANDAGAASDSTLGKWRMNFGLYFYAEPMEGPVSTPEAHGDAA